MLPFRSTKGVPGWAFAGLISCLWLVTFAEAKGQAGCVVDAGFASVDVCKNDAYELGGSPTVPVEFNAQVASLTWEAVGDPNFPFDDPSEPNPEVLISATTTFIVTLVLTDGSVCTDDITLTPVTVPNITLFGTGDTEADGSTFANCAGNNLVTFANVTPPYSPAMVYDIDWGDGDNETATGTNFEHLYDGPGLYEVNVSGTLDLSCTASTTAQVFVGSAPVTPEVTVSDQACTGLTTPIGLSNLTDYTAGTSLTIQVGANVVAQGLVEDLTPPLFWTPAVGNCIDALGSQVLVTTVENACGSELTQNPVYIQLDLAPDFDVFAYGCGNVQFQSDPVCPLVEQAIEWKFYVGDIEDGTEYAPFFIQGNNTSAYVEADFAPGNYTVELSADGCNGETISSTQTFCVGQTPPTQWAQVGGAANVAECEGTIVCVGQPFTWAVDEVMAICSDEVPTTWSLYEVGGGADLNQVNANENDWSYTGVFDQPGAYLITFEAETECGVLDLSCNFVVEQFPDFELVSYQNSVQDSIMCSGETMTVILEPDPASYVDPNSLTWQVLDPEGNPVGFDDCASPLCINFTYDEYGMYQVIAVADGACASETDTLDIEIQGPCPVEYTLLQASPQPEGPIFVPGESFEQAQAFYQCDGELLELQFELDSACGGVVLLENPTTAFVQTSNNSILWNSDLEAPHEGQEFVNVKTISAEGCEFNSQLFFRTLALPDVFVDDTPVVCPGGTAEVCASICCGSTSAYESVDWWSGDSPFATSAEWNLVGTTTDFLPPSEACNATFNAAPPTEGYFLWAEVTDENGCQSTSPLPAFVGVAYVPDGNAGGPGLGGTYWACGESGGSAEVALNGSPAGGDWSSSYPEVSFDETTAEAPVLDAETAYDLTYTNLYTSGELECTQSASACFLVIPEGEDGECVSDSECFDEAACNFNAGPTCYDFGSTCLYDIAEAQIAEGDTLVLCQGNPGSNYFLAAAAPQWGTWYGPGVFSNDDILGNTAYLNTESPGTWTIFFEGGFGSCMTTDSLVVVIQPKPTYNPIPAISGCPGDTVHLGLGAASAAGGLCWNFGWYDEPLPACSDDTTYVIQGNGFLLWNVTDANGCVTYDVIPVEDYGLPAINGGGDKYFCPSTEPQLISANFGPPQSLDCEGYIAVFEGNAEELPFTDVWPLTGNCTSPPTPWDDSVWTYTPDPMVLGVALPEGDEVILVDSLIWTVTNCQSCVNRDTTFVYLRNPIPVEEPPTVFCLGGTPAPITDQEDACWFYPDGSPMINGIFDPALLGPGFHELEGRYGEYSCAAQTSVSVEVSIGPSLQIVADEWACEGEPFQLDAEVSPQNTSSALPWVYDWQFYGTPFGALTGCNGDSSCTLTPETPGGVELFVTDTNGCTGSVYHSVNFPPEVIISFPDFEFCADGGTYPLVGYNPTGGIWSGEKVSDDGMMLCDVPGLYGVEYTVQSEVAECFFSASTVVDVVALNITPIPPMNDAICEGEPYILPVLEGCVWSGPGVENGAIVAALPGCETYTLTCGNEDESCFIQESTTICSIPLPDVTLGPDELECSDIHELEATVGDGLVIANASLLGPANVVGDFPQWEISPGAGVHSYILTVEDDNGCVSKDEVNVSFPPPCFMDCGGPISDVCLGDVVSLNTNDIYVCGCQNPVDCGVEVSWDCPDIPSIQEDGTFTANAPGVFYPTLTYVDGDCIRQCQREVQVSDVPSVDLAWSEATACAGQMVGVQVSSTGLGLDYEYTWVDGSTATSIPSSWVATNDGSEPATAAVSVTAENACGESTDVATITVFPIVPNDFASFQVDTLCTPVLETYEGSVAGNPTWIWSEQLVPQQPGTALLNLEAVEDTVTLNLTVQVGFDESCFTPYEWQVTVVPTPSYDVTIVNPVGCGDSVEPDVSMHLFEGVNPTWTWTGGDELPESFPLGPWTLTEQGLDTLTLVVESDLPGYCSTEENFEIGLYPQAYAEVAIDLNYDGLPCAPVAVQFSDESIGAESIEWYVDFLGGWLEPGGVLPLILPDSGTYSVTWIAHGEHPQCDDVVTTEVGPIFPSPTALIYASQPNYTALELNGTEFVFNDVSQGADETTWILSDGTESDETILNVTHYAPGTYEISQVVRNDWGCTDSTSYTYVIAEEIIMHIPNSFTPNGDNINDVWIPVFAGEGRIEQYELVVTSRSGEIVFQSSDSSEGWAGLGERRGPSGNVVMNDLYMYHIRFIAYATPSMPEPEWQEYVGHITLMD